MKCLVSKVIYDLLVSNSGALELREDPQHGVQVAGLKRINVHTAEEIMVYLETTDVGHTGIFLIVPSSI